MSRIAIRGRICFMPALCFLATALAAQTPGKSCALKIGSNHYIECKRVIVFRDQDVFTMTDKEAFPANINFDVFGADGVKRASVINGKIISGDASRYVVVATEKEYSFMEKSTGRIILLMQKSYSKQKARCELHVWADMYMPAGIRFQCTPDTTNVPVLNAMTGSTFIGVDTAISLY